jgi:ABC-2 type transport system permease protein
MKIISVAWKSILELWREPFVLILSSLLPLSFLLLYVGAYSSVPELATVKVAVDNRHPQGEMLIDQLASLRYADGRPMFSFFPIGDPSAVDDLLRAKQADVVLRIDPGRPSDPFAITFHGDALSMIYLQAGTFLNAAIANVSDHMAGRIPLVRISEHALQTELDAARTGYLIYLPGLIIFAVLTLVPSTAIILGREMRTRTLQRIRLSGLSSVQYLSGIGLSQMAIGFIQAFSIVVALQLLGIRSLGSGLVLAIGVAVVAASAVAWGLMLGAFIRNDSQAVNLGYTVTMVQVFLCGAFFPTPTPTLFTIAGHPMGWFDWLPATNALMALQQALIFGSGLEEVGFRLGIATVLTAFWLCVGVICFQRGRMNEG